MSLSRHIASQIYSNFAFEPTAEQKKLIDTLGDYLASGDESAVFLINGYAGTGKTTVIGALVRTLHRLELPCVLMAPTGRAAKVMGRYAGAEAHTIHKTIYRERAAGGAEGSKFDLNFNKSTDTLYIVDEASMLTGRPASGGGEATLFGSGDLIDDMFDYIRQGRNNKVILVGDQAQLPPVGYAVSPALSPEYMARYGTVWSHTLSEVVRQQSDSGILHNATLIRRLIESGTADIPQLDLRFPDLVRIDSRELIDEIDTCYGRYGQSETAVISRSNKRANHYNQGIRQTILDYEEEIGSGDMVMVVKNNYHYVELDPEARMDFIANGDIARVHRIYRTREKYGFHFAYAELEFPDYDDYRLECWLLLDVLHSPAPSLSREQQSRLFLAVEKEYADITQKGKRYKAVMADEFYCALQVKFAYAITCHKAQGGQWSAIFLDIVLFGEEPMTLELLRWLYTAVTRATERLYLVNYDDRFFLENE
ncbi:ATP-dependent RecD-like DNA helicase [uncultured Rikenella sp.]|uniref:ATP-dependent DNA helicase n=1 Tax=uncultured Rikenella sp. TaxID=368003 RepID=UPI0025DE1DD4|nr:AAA family ATPase [uncultured Rikenella sp.]